MVRTPTQTTLTTAVTDKAQRRFVLGAVTGMTTAGVLVIGKEILAITAIDTVRLTVDANRGREGSEVRPHAAGVPVYFFGAGGGYSKDGASGRVAVDGYTGTLTAPTLPVGSEWRDEDTQYVYKCVDAGAAFQIGEWVVFDAASGASQLGANSKGSCGIIVETVAQSDTLAWAMVVGTCSVALLTSGVTTACVLKAGTGCADISTSAGGNVISNATCTVAPSTATSPTVGDGIGTVYINRPWVYGLTTDIVP